MFNIIVIFATSRPFFFSIVSDSSYPATFSLTSAQNNSDITDLKLLLKTPLWCMVPQYFLFIPADDALRQNAMQSRFFDGCEEETLLLLDLHRSRCSVALSLAHALRPTIHKVVDTIFVLSIIFMMRHVEIVFEFNIGHGKNSSWVHLLTSTFERRRMWSCRS